MAKKSEVKKVEVLATSLESMADHVAALSEVGKMLKKSRLTEYTVLLLLKDMTGIPKIQIKKILDAIPELENRFLK